MERRSYVIMDPATKIKRELTSYYDGWAVGTHIWDEGKEYIVVSRNF